MFLLRYLVIKFIEMRAHITAQNRSTKVDGGYLEYL